MEVEGLSPEVKAMVKATEAFTKEMQTSNSLLGEIKKDTSIGSTFIKDADGLQRILNDVVDRIDRHTKREHNILLLKLGGLVTTLSVGINWLMDFLGHS